MYSVGTLPPVKASSPVCSKMLPSPSAMKISAPDAVLNSSNPLWARSIISSSCKGFVTMEPSSANRSLNAVAPLSTSVSELLRSLMKYAAESAVWIAHITLSPSTSTAAMVAKNSRLIVLWRFIP